MSFIKLIFNEESRSALKESLEPRARIQNIAWPSESSVQLGPIAVGECKRTLFYKILGVKQSNPNTVRGRHICEAGIMYEELCIARFKDHGILHDAQIRIEYELPGTSNKIVSSGKLDAVINDRGKLKGIEIKSISAYKAPAIMGNEKTLPLPAPHNLMQAMTYKYYTKYTEEGKSTGIEEIYLMYVNRSDGSTFYYKVDLDDDGWAIITAINEQGTELYEVNVRGFNSFEDLLRRSGTATSEEARKAEIRINIKDCFSKFDDVYTCTKHEMLPQPDYKITYNKEDLDREFKLGRLSKMKYNKATKKGEPIGDTQCFYCSYRLRCMEDSGVRLKKKKTGR